MIQYYMFKFVYIVFLSCSIPLCAQSNTNSIKRLEPRKDTVIRLNDDAQNTIAVLWKKYKLSSSQKYKQVIAVLMTDRLNTDISVTMDSEICHVFIEEPTAEMAWLLGMCSSSSSWDLLKQYAYAKNTKLAEACQLGLARRGNKTAEILFVNKYALQVESYKKASEQQQADALAVLLVLTWKLEYIGRAESILTVFDSVGSNVITAGNDIVVLRNTAENMRKYLVQIGVFVPKFLIEKEFAEWWADNRDCISGILHNKKELPRLKSSRALITTY